MFERHEERSAEIHARADEVFALLDDHARLSAHMTRRSWRMAWAKFRMTSDAAGFRAVGSHLGLRGRVLGIRIELDEVVVERAAPYRKTWRTTGEPRLLVIGAYQMGFHIAERPNEAVGLTVVIDYDRPRSNMGQLLGSVFGAAYARWCTRRMVADAVRVLSRPT